ncbi:MAG: protein-L-isoaspartate(D-aspartate) O-methyltransferase [Alphaproteobacteria bacterium]|nr:protein-L-isoaspartate(D-aspartate) O-methyltransferase [Alphaproteobacteria bacterium]
MFRRKHQRDGELSREERVRKARDCLLSEIRSEARDTAMLTGRPAFSEPVMEALGKVPREEFAGFPSAEAAYFNAPFAIGHGQTISQPYIVALMSELLDPQPDHVVLEIGTGCGYQAAVISLLVKQVYSVEVVSELAALARERLARLGFANVEVRHGDGAKGWPEHGPFNGIIVTAATPEIPQPLTEQLARGGRMIIPVGRPWIGQDLVLVQKDDRGKLSERVVLPVAFVPLTGGKS